MVTHIAQPVLEPVHLANSYSDPGLRVDQALRDVAAGRPVVVIGRDGLSGDAHLMFAAEHATPALLAFMVRRTSGFICIGLPARECDRLRLPPMYPAYNDRSLTSYTVTVDAAHGISTGISAADRTHTIKVLADATTSAVDLTRPGHIVPCRAVDGGLSRRAGEPEAVVDLARAAGLRPAGVFSAIVSEQHTGEMARGRELTEFSQRYDLTVISTAELMTHCWHQQSGFDPHPSAS